mmetsp:Transcript_5185/g.10601  ORF Transcript_5185/g.10601 Transcript_5185/m.10601 type:complete len:237 (-) Transcript_5185:167-877(-)
MALQMRPQICRNVVATVTPSPKTRLPKAASFRMHAHMRFARRNVSLVPRGRRAVITLAQVQASEALVTAKSLYRQGERMQALKLMEQVDLQSASAEEQKALLYNMGCCHTAFGDIESAQVNLRAAINLGLDFEDALQNPEYIKMEAAAQLRIQLKRFAKSVKVKDKGPLKGKASRPMNDPNRPGYRPSSENPLEDVEGVGGIDTSVKAVAIRVVVVVTVSIVAFIGLFVFGLQFFD